MPNKNKSKKHNFLRRLIYFMKHINFNIGTFIFGAIFIYMAVSFGLYLTAGRVSSYQVVSSPLEKNHTYTALALRNETVFNTGSEGYVNYYARENTKVKKNGLIYTMGNEALKEEDVKLNENSLSKIRSSIAKFSNQFSINNFKATYGFKYELESNILQYSLMQESSLENSELVGNLSGQNAVYAPEEGIVSYSIDGFEGTTAQQISLEDFNQKIYQRSNLKTKEKVKGNTNVYKLITEEEWSLIIPIEDDRVPHLSELKRIKLKFLKDGSTQVGDFSIFVKDDQAYGQIQFDTGLIRYVADRYIEIELVTNIKSGLKIPNSSLVKKEMFLIPESYLSTGGNLNEIGFIRERTDKNGKTKQEFLSTTLYLKQDNMCYVDTIDFQEGDHIIKTDSNEPYILREKKTLEGVYSINKGYAIFRRVVIIDQDENYCIVEKGQEYSIAQFDHIVLNSNAVENKDILY